MNPLAYALMSGNPQMAAIGRGGADPRLAAALAGPKPASQTATTFAAPPAQAPRPVVSVGPKTDSLARALMGGATSSAPQTPFEALGKLAQLWSGNRQQEKFIEAEAARAEAKKQADEQEMMGKLAKFQELVNSGVPPQEAAMQTGVGADEAVKSYFDKDAKPNIETFYDADGRAQPGIYDPSAPGGFRPVGGAKGAVEGESGAAPGFKDITGIRKEVQDLPSYKNYAQALPIYRSMVATAGNNSKASDLNLVYGLGKIFDPGSVVREGEMTLVKDTSSWPEWLKGQYSLLQGGATLTPEARKALITEAQNRAQSYKQAYDQDVAQYHELAQRYNINPKDITFDFGDVPAWPPATAVNPPGPVEPAAPAAMAPAAPQNDALARAKAAIEAGADRAAVIKRLQENGIDPAGL